MSKLAASLLLLPIGVRAVLFLGVVLIFWLLFAKVLLKIFSVIPWILKPVVIGLHRLIELPVSALHKRFGSIFGGIDQGLAEGAEKTSDFLERCRRKMQRPKTVFGKQALIAYIAVSAYLIIPVLANLTSAPFAFWQQAYSEKEAAVMAFVGLSPDSMKQLERPDTVASFTDKRISLSDLTSSQQKSLTLTISLTPFATSLLYRDKIESFPEGSCYNFAFNGENSQLMRILDSVYLFCEHGIWVSPIQNNTQFTLDVKGWYGTDNVVFHKYKSAPSGMPTYALLFSNHTSPQVLVDKWYDIPEEGKLLVKSPTGKEFLTVSLLGKQVQLTTEAAAASVESPYEELVFCYEDGSVLKFSDLYD